MNALRTILLVEDRPDDVARSYDLGANSHIRKPVEFHRLVEAAASLGVYWLLLNEPPPAAAGDTSRE
ncbi:MAG: hypothetical protein ACRDNE_14015 [Gaiellaceae bacterium]